MLTAFGRVEPVADPRSDWFVRAGCPRRRRHAPRLTAAPTAERYASGHGFHHSAAGPSPGVVERVKLRNGLRVVLAPDRSAPVVGVAVYYDVGIRSEPQGRTGFAHLFEHLMFQGSASLGKMELVN